MCGIRGMFGSSKQDKQTIKSFDSIASRGPDSREIYSIGDCQMGFHRLAIIDTSEHGMQPFTIDSPNHTISWTCNGEIYNHKQLEQTYNLSDSLQSSSDCECIGYLYLQVGFTQMIKCLDGEFAITMIISDKQTQTQILYLARDTYGVRPLFVGRDEVGGLGWASEAKALIGLYKHITPFTPGTIYDSKSDLSISYTAYGVDTDMDMINDEHQALAIVRDTIYDAVGKRLTADRPVGCLLSGGLDSSLMCGIAASMSDHPIHTFTIGLQGGTDIAYAEKVAAHLGSIHTTVIITIQQALEAIDEVIYTIESWDTTTVRASVWQYLLGKYISTYTDIKVLLTGEGADEMCGGYMYFHNAPDPVSFDTECRRLLDDIYLYDGLRVDRAMSGHGLEVRIPLLDPKVVSTYLSIDPSLRMPSPYRMEKYLVRKAFAQDKIVPDEVLRRRKEAFSDGVSQQTKSWFEIIQEYIDTIVSDDEYEKYLTDLQVTCGLSLDAILTDPCSSHPKTKEQYYYRRKFVEYFGENRVSLIPYYRLPKRSGQVTEASARVLQSYQQ